MNIYCDICKTEHSEAELEQTGGGWRPSATPGVSTNWVTLRCNFTGEEYNLVWDEPDDDEAEPTAPDLSIPYADHEERNP